MSNPKYRPTTTLATLGWLAEEAGEVQAAVGKTIRWGLASRNPEPGSSKEMNGDWILRELKDLREAMDLAESVVRAEMQAVDGYERK